MHRVSQSDTVVILLFILVGLLFLGQCLFFHTTKILASWLGAYVSMVHIDITTAPLHIDYGTITSSGVDTLLLSS